MARSAKPVALCGDSKLTKAEKEAREEAEKRYKGVSDLVYQCPEDLTTEREQELYIFIVNQLKSAAILNDLDIEIIKATVYCIINMNDANEAVKKHGAVILDENGKLYKNPAVNIYKDYHTMYMAEILKVLVKEV